MLHIASYWVETQLKVYTEVQASSGFFAMSELMNYELLFPGKYSLMHLASTRVINYSVSPALITVGRDTVSLFNVSINQSLFVSAKCPQKRYKIH